MFHHIKLQKKSKKWKKYLPAYLVWKEKTLFYMCLIDLFKLYLFMNILFVYEIPVMKMRLCYILVK